jgi:hypothetical protein
VSTSDSNATARPNSFYSNRIIEQYASIETKKVTINQLIAFGRHMNEHKLLKSANYVKHELCVRLGESEDGFNFAHCPFLIFL